MLQENLHKEIGLEGYGFFTVLDNIFSDLETDEVSYPMKIWSRLLNCTEEAVSKNLERLSEMQYVKIFANHDEIHISLLHEKRRGKGRGERGVWGVSGVRKGEELSLPDEILNNIYIKEKIIKKKSEIVEDKVFNLQNASKIYCRFCKIPSCRFGEIIAIYPRKSDFKLAHAIYRRQRLNVIVDKIISDVAQKSLHHQPWLIDDGKYIHHLKTYFNGKMWNDPIRYKKTERQHHERSTYQHVKPTAKIFTIESIADKARRQREAFRAAEY
jgi:ribosomal protein L16/L10AE